MPTISVIIPAYNAERTILETVASVQQQTFSDFELIVINDGSKDRTLEILQSINDERLKILSYENGGLPVARNRGISRATGEFISFLDADDLWTPDKLELQVAVLQQHPEAGVAYSWSRFVFKPEGYSYVEDSHSFEGNVYDKMLVVNFIHSGSNVMIRRKAIDSVGEFDPTLKSFEDWDYWVRLSAKWPFAVVPKPQIIYHQYSGSMSDNLPIMEKNFLVVADKAYQSAPPELQPLKKQTLAWGYKYFAHQYLNRSNTNPNDVNQAGIKLWDAIRMYPNILFESYTQNLIKWFIKKRFLKIYNPAFKYN